MTNLGTDQKLDTAGLSSKILVAITQGIAEQGADILPGVVKNAVFDMVIAVLSCIRLY